MIKLSARDVGEAIAGDTLRWIGGNGDCLNNGDLVKVLGVSRGQLDFEVIQNKHSSTRVGQKFNSWRLGNYSWEFAEPSLPPKPHEYSPVNMTGRYRTIGD